jgi:hypothetical protein
MKQALDLFHDNLAQLGHLQVIHTGLTTQTTSALDLSDILRARLVMAVSAFDLFVHELVRLGMLECYFRYRTPTPAFLAFRVPLSNVLDAIASPSLPQWLEDEIRQQHGWKSFQHSDKVAEAIRMISTVSLWEEVGKKMSRPANDAKQTLNLIVDRRNKIAHEADCIPSAPGCRWPISSTVVDEATNFLAQTVEAIYASI